MKRLVLFVLLIVCTAPMIGQKLPSQMNECELFDYLTSLSQKNYVNPKYQQVKDSFALRADLLRTLESYMLVHASYVIAPIYLESDSHPKACSTYVQQYKEELKRQKDNSKLINVRSEVHRARSIVQQTKFNIRDILIDLTDLNKVDNKDVSIYVTELERAYTVERLYQYLDSAYTDKSVNPSLYALPKLVKQNNLKLLAERINELDQNLFVWYEHYDSQPNLIKGFEMHHDNDVLLFPFVNINQDRELTGGFKFTVVTDYLKWRWVRPLSHWLDPTNESRVLTYQTVSVIGGGYTPYIRYHNDSALADSIYQYDRPFSSYMGWERAKHRTWRSGLIRHRGEFQFGYLGISQGRKIQAQLHADVIYDSQFVRGWDQQIGNGGRMILQLNHHADFLLASTTNRYPSVLRHRNYKVDEPTHKYAGWNLIGETEFKTGTLNTSMGLGLRLSTLDLLKQSGSHMIASKPGSRDEFGWMIDAGFNYRWIVRNSLLQGMGWLRTWPEDQYDIVAQSPYVLRKDEITHNMFYFDYGFTFRWRKSTVYFRHIWHNLEYTTRLKEFTSDLNTADDENYINVVMPEQNSFQNFRIGETIIYGYGVIGISWLIE